MSTKKRQPKIKKLTFLEFAEESTKKDSHEVYSALGWDRRRYFKQKENLYFPFWHLEDLRFALGMTEPKFYSLVRQFLNGSEG